MLKDPESRSYEALYPTFKKPVLVSDDQLQKRRNARSLLLEKTQIPHNNIPTTAFAKGERGTYGGAIGEKSIGPWEETLLSRTFMSRQNEQILQNGIRAGVHTKSGGKFLVSQQDSDQLRAVMQGVFLQSAKNSLSESVADQIEVLNEKVLDFCIDMIYKEARSYSLYLNNITKRPMPSMVPMMTRDNQELVAGPWFSEKRGRK